MENCIRLIISGTPGTFAATATFECKQQTVNSNLTNWPKYEYIPQASF